MDLAHGRNHCQNVRLVTALWALTYMSSLKPKPLFALSTGGIALGLCDSAHPVGLWQLNEASNAGMCLFLPYPNTKLQQGKSEF